MIYGTKLTYIYICRVYKCLHEIENVKNQTSPNWLEFYKTANVISTYEIHTVNFFILN